MGGDNDKNNFLSCLISTLHRNADGALPLTSFAATDTINETERDMLIAAGWEYLDISFYA